MLLFINGRKGSPEGLKKKVQFFLNLHNLRGLLFWSFKNANYCRLKIWPIVPCHNYHLKTLFIDVGPNIRIWILTSLRYSGNLRDLIRLICFFLNDLFVCLFLKKPISGMFSIPRLSKETCKRICFFSSLFLFVFIEQQTNQGPREEKCDPRLSGISHCNARILEK